MAANWMNWIIIFICTNHFWLGFVMLHQDLATISFWCLKKKKILDHTKKQWRQLDPSPAAEFLRTPVCLTEVICVLMAVITPPLRNWKQSQGLAKVLREHTQNMSMVVLWALAPSSVIRTEPSFIQLGGGGSPILAKAVHLLVWKFMTSFTVTIFDVLTEKERKEGIALEQSTPLQ